VPHIDLPVRMLLLCFH